MSQILKALGIDRMSCEERIALVQEIWDSVVAENAGPFLSEEQLRELERRAADDDADPDGGIPWEEIRNAAHSRFQK